MRSRGFRRRMARVGGCRSRRQVPAAHGLGVRGFKPGFARSEVLLGAVARRTGARIGRRGGAALGSCLSPRPLSSFSHPLFRLHQLQLLQSVKNVKEILQ